MLIAGLDEAGRGPVIGSLVIGCVIFNEKDLPILDDIGVDDSKKITSKRREILAKKIKSHAVSYDILEITAKDINALHKKGLTLNEIEEISFAKLINGIKPQPDIIYLDAADVIEDRFGKTIGSMLRFKPKKIISKHRGDAIFKIVGAASILAKTKRDQIIEEYKKEYGNIGSGYPSDPYTKKFLKSYYYSNQKFPPIVRTWWKTAENIKKDYEMQKKQKKLTEF
ncbi:ribonuclease HII [Promethearchaeum syntrophicum]|uniref:Ribonuclease HII n=1 Tax=Promethearchaeum syntrophicum TaxID=2594042 RepID=A0A5B9D635_9ARCH|nr:ribonuclease HII [Candidatus Prometheoarchaeum syntrophicum]QEE14465.1 Ribonuclease HII [Candidatus Prometheoarchaeum syntrophicum]